MKILSWNVNGIRACRRHGFLDWFASEAADVGAPQIQRAQDDLGQVGIGQYEGRKIDRYRNVREYLLPFAALA